MIIQKGRIFGTGGTNFTITDSMLADSEHSYNMVHQWRVKSGMSFYNCTRVNDTTISLSNPASEDIFNFYIEYTYDNITWEELEMEGTLYASLGANNISTTLVGNTIGTSVRTVSGLCSSSNVNRYAQYCPNGSSPYRLGDFRWYSHGTPNGVCLSANPGNRTIVWNGSTSITGFITKLFKSPYSFTQCRAALYIDGVLKGTVSADLSTLNGKYYGFVVNNDYYNQDTATKSCAIKAEQYSGSSWVAYETYTFNITFTGSPWGVCTVNSETHSGSNYDVNFSYTGALSNVRLTINGTVSGVPRSATRTYDTVGASPTTATVTSALVFDAEVLYTLDTLISGTWYTLASGEFI